MRYCVACGGDPYLEHISYWCDDGDPENRVKLNSILIAVGLELMCVHMLLAAHWHSASRSYLYLPCLLVIISQVFISSLWLGSMRTCSSPRISRSSHFYLSPCPFFLLQFQFSVAHLSLPHLLRRSAAVGDPTSWIGDTCSQPLPRTPNSTSYGIEEPALCPPLLAMLETHDTPREHQISELLGKRSSRTRLRET